MPNRITYDEACAMAATDQGLDPICAVLADAGLPHGVDQTGGFTMCVNIPLVEGGRQFLYATDASEYHGGESEGTALVCRYWSCPEDAPCGGEGYWQPEDIADGVALSELPALVRAEVDRSPVPCPVCTEAQESGPVAP